MKSIETKSIQFELKDMDKAKRTAVIAHANYDNIDKGKDISRKGMFTKSWNESKGDISFYLNHNDEQAPGKVIDVFEDGSKAYTKAWLGTHTLGNDTLIMMDEQIIKNASFGYIPEKKNYIQVKGQMVRELVEVKHIETSVLTKMPMNPLTGVISVTKSFNDVPEFKTLTPDEQSILKQLLSLDQATLERLISLSGSINEKSDLFTWVLYQISRRSDFMADVRSQIRYNSGELKEFQSHIQTMKSFVKNTKASDDCIKSIQKEIEQAENFITNYDTASTQFANEPDASRKDDELLAQLLLIKERI